MYPAHIDDHTFEIETATSMLGRCGGISSRLARQPKTDTRLDGGQIKFSYACRYQQEFLGQTIE